LPRLGQAGSLLGMDWNIVLFTVALAIVTGILFGSVPALVASRASNLTTRSSLGHSARRRILDLS
jgi:ABC-type antimicrobial peptide transport system permease subunit